MALSENAKYVLSKLPKSGAEIPYAAICQRTRKEFDGAEVRAALLELQEHRAAGLTYGQGWHRVLWKAISIRGDVKVALVDGEEIISVEATRYGTQAAAAREARFRNQTVADTAKLADVSN
jgi:hypothetical protein